MARRRLPNPALRLQARLAPRTRERLTRLAPPGLSREELCRAYLDEDRSAAAIARDAGCRVSTVLFHLALHGIPIRSRGRP